MGKFVFFMLQSDRHFLLFPLVKSMTRFRLRRAASLLLNCSGHHVANPQRAAPVPYTELLQLPSQTVQVALSMLLLGRLLAQCHGAGRTAGKASQNAGIARDV